MTLSDRALARAREAVDVAFRLHGRDLGGMDCVGLVAWAWELPAPTGYALRAAPGDRIVKALVGLGFVHSDGPGAIVVAAPGPGQLHLGIASEGGLIHADAVARRVVERPGAVPWPVVDWWIRED